MKTIKLSSQTFQIGQEEYPQKQIFPEKVDYLHSIDLFICQI